MSKVKLYKDMPPLVLAVLINCEAWLVGGAAMYAVDETCLVPRDYDLIVPPGGWNDACRIAAATGQSVAFNSFGGLKIGGLVDLWHGTLDEFLTIAGVRARVALRLRPEAIVRVG